MGSGGKVECPRCGVPFGGRTMGQSDYPRIPGFAVEGLLGEGGMATVYRGRDERTGKAVALKLTHPQMSGDPELLQRFLQELRTASSLKHEHVLETLSFGESMGRWYIACEIADGGTVDDLTSRFGRLPVQIAALFAQQTLLGLACAHERGIVHRDIKPANLLLFKSGSLKVSDFGIAKSNKGQNLTQTGQLVGTPAFMSPEQAQGLKLDGRSDLFAVGVLLVELASGRNPYETETISGTLLEIIHGNTRLTADWAPHAPEALERVCDRLLEKQPERRYQSAQAAASDLAAMLAPTLARRPTLLADYLAAPASVAVDLDRELADELAGQALAAFAEGPGGRVRAVTSLFKATLLAPADRDLAEQLARMCSESGFRIGPAESPKAKELEAEMTKKPEAQGLVRLSQLYRMEGNVLGAVLCLKRVIRMKPDDGYALGQLRALQGDGAPAAAGAPSVPAPTRQIPQPTAVAQGDKAVSTGLQPTIRAPVPTGPQAAVPQRAPTPAPQPAASSPMIRTSSPRTSGTARRGAGEEQERVGVGELLSAHWKTILGVTLSAGVVVWLAMPPKRTPKPPSPEETGEVRPPPPSPTQPGKAVRPPGERLDHAIGLLRAHDLTGGLAELDALISEYPNSPEAKRAQLRRGTALLEANRVAEASDALGRFIVEHPTSDDLPEALLRRGEANARLIKPAQAFADYDDLLRKYGTGPFATEARLLRGELYALRGEKAAAMSDLRLVVAATGPGDTRQRRAQEALARMGASAQPAPPPAPGAPIAPPAPAPSGGAGAAAPTP